MIRYRVMLREAEVAELSAIISKGAHSTRTFRNAYMLLNCDEGLFGNKVGNKQLARMLRVNARTIERVKKRFVEEGWEAVPEDKPSCRTYSRKVDGETQTAIPNIRGFT